MAMLVIQFVLIAAVIVAAGTILATAADDIAEATGWGRLLIGSVLLAGATSLPELTVDISAVKLGMADLAVGDLLGSSLMNLLILAVLDLTHYSSGRMLSRTAAAHAMAGLVSVALVSIVGLGLLTTSRAPHWSFLEVHVSIWVVAAGYIWGVRMVFLDQRIALRVAEDSQLLEEKSQQPKSLWKAVLYFVSAAIVILLVGPHLAESAGLIADKSGLGKTFVGTTLVAFSTSLPELVASFAAIRIGAFDLAIGNVFGSNAFNMLLLFPLDAMHAGPLLQSVSPSHLASVLSSVMATSVVIMGQLYHLERRRRFIEPDAWIVIVLILVGLGIVYANGAADGA